MEKKAKNSCILLLCWPGKEKNQPPARVSSAIQPKFPPCNILSSALQLQFLLQGKARGKGKVQVALSHAPCTTHIATGI